MSSMPRWVVPTNITLTLPPTLTRQVLLSQLESYSDSDLSDAAYDYDEESEPVSELGELDTQVYGPF